MLITKRISAQNYGGKTYTYIRIFVFLNVEGDMAVKKSWVRKEVWFTDDEIRVLEVMAEDKGVSVKQMIEMMVRERLQGRVKGRVGRVEDTASVMEMDDITKDKVVQQEMSSLWDEVRSEINAK